MARDRFHHNWWWLLVVLILVSGSWVNLVLSSSSAPSYDRLQSYHHHYYSLPSSSVIKRSSNLYSTGAPADVLVFLGDHCDDQSDTNEIQAFLSAYSAKISIRMLQRSLTCESKSWGLGVLVQALGQATTKALIAALDPNTCEVAARLAHLWDKPLLTWTCPLRIIEENKPSSTIRLSPSVPAVAQALAEIFLHFRWKTVAVVSTDHEPWPSLDRSVIGALRSIGIVPRHHTVLPHRGTNKQIHGTLKLLHTVPCRVIVLCLPVEDEEFAKRAIVQINAKNSIVLLVHPETPNPFLPASVNPYTTIVQSRSSLLNNHTDVETPEKLMNNKRFPTFINPEFVLPRNFLALVPFDQRYDLERIYNGTQIYVEPNILEHLNESLNILTHDNSSLDTNNNKMYTYGVLAWRTNAWKPILQVIEHDERLLLRAFMDNNYLADEESSDVLCEDENDCAADLIPLRAAHIITIVLGSLLFALMILVTVALIRRHLLNKRMSKGPYKIILTASDFVFPQMPDSRRVDEGIEAMLCCWLHQLQEFGGPEVEKPDLLQGSVGSLKTHHGIQASTGSLARHTIFKDPRARYNGDLVQLKELPSQGTFELKSKAMDVLVMVHGLRHENLNPLIGCLTEPTRPCLVSEYCSRGSLEDVLVQDEIKLDWSFRLSLLTDLVRGIKYLHSSPIRVHGYLTSRNCVIDARWVLKVTDYGLPAFYEAQNLVPPTKTARDLLWTAPELLRHPHLQKRGTQPGDVYSFGIIMQEVVVRGEPFCMLALTPEEIIEKVKKPPPLIRPSVSKGAAPPEAINIMRQCWAEAADMRPDFNAVHDLFKKLNHGRKVNFVDTMFQMLEKYSNNLEELIRERTEQLDMEKKKTEQLLNRMLPSTVAEKLKLGMPVDPEEFAEVTIYFSDIVGFTTISAYSTPFQVVDLLNDLYTCFDATINAYTVYKVETIGDAYMVVGGCPVRIPDHASQIATMALDLLHQSGKFKLKHLPKTQLRLRIGLHTGPCCAGVVGLTMPRYCLFGDTVNTASRMESTGAPWRIHLSQATWNRLNEVGGYHIEYRGRTDIKGKGKMPTYWLLGKQGFDKDLPTPPSLGEDHGLEESEILENLANRNDSLPEMEIGQGQQSVEERTISIEQDESSGDQSCSIVSTSGTGEQSSSPSRSVVNVSQTTASGSGKCVGKQRVFVSVHDDTNTSNLTTISSEAATTAMEIFRDIVKSPPEPYGAVSSTGMTKNICSDNQILGTPVSASEVAAALLGAASSTSSLTSLQSGSSAFRTRHRRLAAASGGSVIGEDDLSTPYNHYRCLSPNEYNLSSTGKGSSGRFLKRQFSLDRADDPLTIASIISEQQPSQQSINRAGQRLCKQNSAGAANDLERIEEIPSSSSIGTTTQPILRHRDQQAGYRHAASMSLSVESLTLH
ncbi:retinal guanylyl cyclase 2 isoform X2 [Venturia canescens]|uniref:retinal guanylyl cyclase 2 isoform X2 n=1 Tax=Venturia canescens TaxID=32260 RepID=UPI001C9CA0B5|nr:retinal guanylyl cyclase 2 isoform X2 [Venturia canescens]